MSRKQDIIDHAMTYFNTHGYGASSLHQLAKSMEISRGNLTYHFKTKTDLLHAIVEQMWATLERKRAESKQFPSFENLHREIRDFQVIQQQYAFVFRESQILSEPRMLANLQRIYDQRIQDFLATMAFSIEIGNLRPEPVPGTYHNLCRALWMFGFYWSDHRKYAVKGEADRWDKAMWSLLLPFFTEKGLAAFMTYFGREYYDSLGDDFWGDGTRIARI